MGAGRIWEISVSFTQLCCAVNLKLLQKTKSIKTHTHIHTLARSPPKVCLSEAIPPETSKEAIFKPKQRSQELSGWISPNDTTKKPFLAFFTVLRTSQVSISHSTEHLLRCKGPREGSSRSWPLCEYEFGQAYSESRKKGERHRPGKGLQTQDTQHPAR